MKGGEIDRNGGTGFGYVCTTVAALELRTSASILFERRESAPRRENLACGPGPASAGWPPLMARPLAAKGGGACPSMFSTPGFRPVPQGGEGAWGLTLHEPRHSVCAQQDSQGWSSPGPGYEPLTGVSTPAGMPFSFMAR